MFGVMSYCLECQVILEPVGIRGFRLLILQRSSAAAAFCSLDMTCESILGSTGTKGIQCHLATPIPMTIFLAGDELLTKLPRVFNRLASGSSIAPQSVC